MILLGGIQRQSGTFLISLMHLVGLSCLSWKGSPSIDSYAIFLKSSKEVQLKNQALPYLVRQLKDYATVQHIPDNSTVIDAYKLLNAVVVDDEYNMLRYFSILKNTYNGKTLKNTTERLPIASSRKCC